MTDAVRLVELTRRDHRGDREVVESAHVGHVVVVDDDGEVVAALGDPDRLTYHRSAVKPFQATAMLEAIESADALDDAEVAVGWASHTAEDVHLEAVRRILGRAGLEEDELTCPPADRASAPGTGLARIHYNCSGKHALFGWAGTLLDVPRAHWLDPASPVQRPVLAAVVDACGPVDAVAVDGCGAPAVAGPLVGLARGFAALRRDPRWARVVAAGFSEPVLVGGSSRPESALLAAGVVAKPGAEGVFAVAFDDADGNRLAAAVKVEDGADRAAATAAVALVAALGGPVVEWEHQILGGGVVQGVCRATAAVTGLSAA